MAVAHDNPMVIANDLLRKGWVHYFVPMGDDLTARLGWLVDQYGLPIGEFDPWTLEEHKTWMLVRMEDGFKRKMDFPHDYLLLFENQEMFMMYKLRWP